MRQPPGAEGIRDPGGVTFDDGVARRADETEGLPADWITDAITGVHPHVSQRGDSASTVGVIGFSVVRTDENVAVRPDACLSGTLKGLLRGGVEALNRRASGRTRVGRLALDDGMPAHRHRGEPDHAGERGRHIVAHLDTDHVFVVVPRRGDLNARGSDLVADGVGGHVVLDGAGRCGGQGHVEVLRHVVGGNGFGVRTGGQFPTPGERGSVGDALGGPAFLVGVADVDDERRESHESDQGQAGEDQRGAALVCQGRGDSRLDPRQEPPATALIEDLHRDIFGPFLPESSPTSCRARCRCHFGYQQTD